MNVYFKTAEEMHVRETRYPGAEHMCPVLSSRGTSSRIESSILSEIDEIRNVSFCSDMRFMSVCYRKNTQKGNRGHQQEASTPPLKAGFPPWIGTFSR